MNGVYNSTKDCISRQYLSQFHLSPQLQSIFFNKKKPSLLQSLFLQIKDFLRCHLSSYPCVMRLILPFLSVALFYSMKKKSHLTCCLLVYRFVSADETSLIFF